jgi:hypothetical protein
MLMTYCCRVDCKQTNLGKLMETNGPRLLGSAYKDPISSFILFYKFSVDNQEACCSKLVKYSPRYFFSTEFIRCKVDV